MILWILGFENLGRVVEPLALEKSCTFVMLLTRLFEVIVCSVMGRRTCIVEVRVGSVSLRFGVNFTRVVEPALLLLVTLYVIFFVFEGVEPALLLSVAPYVTSLPSGAVQSSPHPTRLFILFLAA